MIPLGDPVSTGQLTTFDRTNNRKVVTVGPGQSVELGQLDGPGYLATIWLTFPGWFWAHWEPDRPVDQRIMKSVILTVTCDHADGPQVRSPIADLCGVGLGQAANFAAGGLGMSSGGFYLKFPIPYAEHVRIEVTNVDPEHETDIFANVLYQSVAALPPGTPYFHASYRSGRNPGDEDLLIADLPGPGRYCGCTLSMQSSRPNNLSFLEAPEQVYLDDDDQPRLLGTGMEDYFLGGWYFREGTFAGPDHGVPIKEPFASSVAMYRIHDQDAIHFDRRLRFLFHPTWAPENLHPYAYSTVAFSYLDRPHPAPELPAADQLWPWYRVTDTDHQSMP